jgi:hypothetical protein
MLDENQIRIAVFLGVLLVMAILEAMLPKRKRVQSRNDAGQQTCH